VKELNAFQFSKLVAHYAEFALEFLLFCLTIAATVFAAIFILALVWTAIVGMIEVILGRPL